MDSLRRLVLSGWVGTVVGDPCAPDALVFVHERSGICDSVLVKSYDDAVAMRMVVGESVRTVSGAVDDVVSAVLAWSPLTVR